MVRRSVVAIACLVSTALLAVGCKGDGDGGSTKSGAPTPTRQALTGPPRPALLLTHAWFYNDAEGRPTPGPARLDIWREDGGKWSYTRLEDPDSNVFHKALPYDGGILTIGAEKAILKKWTFSDGQWHDEKLWEQSWGGRFDRLRDVEIGDVDGDGRDEIVMATHDAGVVAVADVAADGKISVTELDQKPDTFVHEIEIGDIDGDGKLEFFATPSDRNRANQSQSGGVVMYRWNGKTYDRTWVEHQEGTHAKEILATDMDGDGKAELFSVLEAEVDPSDKSKLLKPVEIRQYFLQPDGTFKHKAIATIDDRLTRFLVAADFDGDGRKELVAAAFKRGLFYITPPPSGSDAMWSVDLIDGDSSGFEHAEYVADLDGDGKLELYVAADDQRKLCRYDYKGGKTFDRTVLGTLDEDVLTWNITTGTF